MRRAVLGLFAHIALSCEPAQDSYLDIRLDVVANLSPLNEIAPLWEYK